MNDRSTGYGEAQAPGRTEDLPLLTGHGRFAGDIHPDGMAHGVFLRSPHAHAAILAVDTAAARAVPGVLGVFTASDMAGRAVTADELFEPAFNLDLGCKYLVWLAKRLDGDLRLVLMSYNAGIQRVLTWQKKTRDVDEILARHAFDETRAYVEKVLGFRAALKS